MTAVAAGDRPRKGGTGGGHGTSPPPQQQQQKPPEQWLRCPRCDSPNTKFCYYNNYSLSQPRHFCKTCRRYWTKGGALRNVPVGGGCRKNKRSRSTSRLSLNLPVDGCVGGVSAAVDQQSSARLGFLGSGATVVSWQIGNAPAADYQGIMAPPRLHVPAVGQYVPFVEWPPSGPSTVDLTGGAGNGSAGHATSVAHSGAVSSSIASSIESLSFINQDLHWKLQQHRLSTMFLGPPTAAHVVDGAAPAHVGRAFFQTAVGAHGMEATVPAVTSWIMDSSYVLPPPPANRAAATATTTICNINSGRSSGDDDHATPNNNCCSGIPAWGDMSTFAMLP